MRLGAALRERWAPLLPVWRREAQGSFALQTPYSELVVRRENNGGWVLERNGRALHYVFGRIEAGRHVFDDYHEAQVRGLL
jgi:hypothetical protein